MNKITIILLMITCLSCSKKREIETRFIANNNEYWEYRDYCHNVHGIFFQFRKNGSHDKYLGSYVGFDLFNDDGDLLSGPRTWSIKNDSVFLWDKRIYKIEKITNKEIILSYFHYEEKEKKCFVRLSKWVLTPKGPKLLDELDTIKK